MKNFIDLIQENSENDHDHASAAHKMAQLCKELQNVVGKMNDLYEQNQFLNEIQPKDFSQIIPMSLDEWHMEIMSIVEDWNDISKAEPKGE